MNQPLEHLRSDPLCKESTADSIMRGLTKDRGKACRVCRPAPEPEPGKIKGLPEQYQPKAKTFSELLDEAIKKPFMDGYNRTRAENHYTFPAPKSESDPDWTADFFAGPAKGSPPAPAELPAESRQSIAQMYSQFQEFQRVGFSRDEAWELIRGGWLTICAVQARWLMENGRG